MQTHDVRILFHIFFQFPLPLPLSMLPFCQPPDHCALHAILSPHRHQKVVCEDDDNHIRLPSLSDLCRPFTGQCLNLTTETIRFDEGYPSGLHTQEQEDYSAIVDAFLAESRRRPSSSAVAFWEKIRPGVVRSSLFLLLSNMTLIVSISNVIDAFWKVACVKANGTLPHAFNALTTSAPVLRMKGASVL